MFHIIAQCRPTSDASIKHTVNQEQLSSNDSIDMSPNESYGKTTVPYITTGDVNVYYSCTSNSHTLQGSNEFGMNTNRAYEANDTNVEDSESQKDYDYVID